MKKKLEIYNNYEIMSPEELSAALKSFAGLSNDELKAVNKAAKILAKNYTPRQEISKTAGK